MLASAFRKPQLSLAPVPMKRKRLKISSRSVRKALGVHATSIGALLLFTATATPARAVDGIWDTAPSTNDWDDYFNWSGLVTPENPGDTATFNTSSETQPTLSLDVTIESITFNPGASIFTIQTNGNVLTLLVTESSITQETCRRSTIIPERHHFLTPRLQGMRRSTTPGRAVSQDSSKTRPQGMQRSITFLTVKLAPERQDFLATRLPGNATINNSGPSSFTGFFDNSTAANATIVNSGGAVSGALGGDTFFFDASNAGSATINNNAATVGGASGGLTGFSGTSNAGSATITNNGATVDGASSGVTEFSGTSNAGSATIIDTRNERWIERIYKVSRLFRRGNRPARLRTGTAPSILAD